MTVEIPDRRRVEKFVVARCGAAALPELRLVAAAASELGRYFVPPADEDAPDFPRDPDEICETLYCAGLLSDSIERHGVPFDDIVLLTNLETAELVGRATQDLRVPLPQRIRLYASQLVESDSLTHVLALARFQSMQRSVIATSLRYNPVDGQELIERWALAIANYLPVMTAIRRSMSLQDAARVLRHDLAEAMTQAVARANKARKAARAAELQRRIANKRKPQ